jgi:dipeptidyl-peptidase-4
MKEKKRLPLLASLLFICSIASGYKPMKLEDIYLNRKFEPTTPASMYTTRDEKSFTTLENQKIVQYNLATGQKERIIFSKNEHEELKGEYIYDYNFNLNEDKILLTTNAKTIYRHSYMADFYIYDTRENKTTPLSNEGGQMLATFSPDGNKVAFVRGNNLYMKDLKNNEEIALTTDGEWNKIINGEPDWVYEEEFGFAKGFAWSPGSDRLAYYKFDEGHVKLYNMTLYKELYPEWYQYKYPKAGEENAHVSIHVYHLENGKTIEMDTGKEKDQYIPRIKWTRDNNQLAVARLNRLQNHLELLLCNSENGKSKVIYEDREERYISEITDNHFIFLDNGKEFIVLNEKTGYHHFSLHSLQEGKLHQITRGEWDVACFVAYDNETQTLYYESHETSPLEKQLFAIRKDGTGKRQITTKPGHHTIFFTKQNTFFIDVHTAANQPPVYTLHGKNGELLRVIEDNNNLINSMKEHGFVEKDFIKVPTENDIELNAFMMKPMNFDESKQYPLFMFVYGGPESQQVTNSWGRYLAWFQYLTQQGYIVACVDNRGTGGRGEKFRKSTYLELGKLETIDQINSAKHLGSLPYIDEQRIGIFGWSYGGYLSLLCLTKGAEHFAAGLAVAPLTNWRFYDTIYSERFLQTPAANPEGYDENSPINHVDKLKGNILLVHGMADDNVHLQNTIEFVDALVEAGKEYDLHLYPGQNHSITNSKDRYHLFKKMTEFLEENL